ncbi:hypothetical protein [Streptomyces zagrosensis]|uniref:Uncharacterized protein n=1 Tax=Streptomyces zagrosensis TaxID=1042984 RepID=A0A7W9QBV9_9ACTN|nr:hypothetical protein [Streptomyces zagrosensis]MBB5936913.1 hypothetical protein [Streptomyces zagrosensis]
MPDVPVPRPDVPKRQSVTGALLLCRADPDDVRPSAGLLPAPLLLAPAGAGWSVLLAAEPEAEPPGEMSDEPPEDSPGESAPRATARATGRGGPMRGRAAVADLARTVAAGESWPVIGVWWGPDGAGFTVASGFRRPVAHAWLADGTPTGDFGAAQALLTRLRLDPVRDGAALEELTQAQPGKTQTQPGKPQTQPGETQAQPGEIKPGANGSQPSAPVEFGPGAASCQRLVALLAVLTRAGLDLPAGLTPGEPEHRLRSALHAAPGFEAVPGRGGHGWRDAVRAELDSVDSGPRGRWLRGPRARAMGAAQLAAGLPLTAWGLRRGRPGWALVGALLTADGAAGLAYDGLRSR